MNNAGIHISINTTTWWKEKGKFEVRIKSLHMDDYSENLWSHWLKKTKTCWENESHNGMNRTNTLNEDEFNNNDDITNDNNNTWTNVNRNSCL